MLMFIFVSSKNCSTLLMQETAIMLLYVLATLSIVFKAPYLKIFLVLISISFKTEMADVASVSLILGISKITLAASKATASPFRVNDDSRYFIKPFYYLRNKLH